MTPHREIKSLRGEQWKEIPFPPGALQKKYAVSSFGRVVSFMEDIASGKLMKCGLVGGYPAFRPKPFGKYKTYYIHRLVAETFLEKPSEAHDYVIHLDFDKEHNRIPNLKWATKSEMQEHQQHSPLVIKSREERKNRKPQKGHKLTATDVMRIKKMIFNPNRKTRMKIIAKQFGISEMQLYRIKSGENWGHVNAE